VHGFGFNTLAVVTAVGFAGPLLAALPRARIPVIIGELTAGLIIGRTGSATPSCARRRRGRWCGRL